MKNLSHEEKEKILSEIVCIKEEIWETKSYIESDICIRCSEMYTTLFRLEQSLKGLMHKIADDHS